MLNNRELVHPVHQRVALVDDTFEITGNAGNEFITSNQVRRVHRHLLTAQEIGFDPVFFVFDPLDESVLFKFFYNP